MTIYRATSIAAIVLGLIVLVYSGLVKGAWVFALGGAISLALTAMLFAALDDILLELKAVRRGRE